MAAGSGAGPTGRSVASMVDPPRLRASDALGNAQPPGHSLLHLRPAVKRNARRLRTLQPLYPHPAPCRVVGEHRGGVGAAADDELRVEWPPGRRAGFLIAEV